MVYLDAKINTTKVNRLFRINIESITHIICYNIELGNRTNNGDFLKSSASNSFQTALFFSVVYECLNYLFFDKKKYK